MIIDGIVLAGGRSSRLGGVPKASLVLKGRTLLETVVWTVARVSRAVAVVGDVAAETLPANIIRARESPVFGGPAAGIAAGLDALSEARPAMQDEVEWVLVFACDLPLAGHLVSALIAALHQRTASGSHAAGGEADGLVVVDDTGRRQPLAAIYSTSRLAESVARIRDRSALTGSSVSAMISGLELIEVHVPAGAARDVDTWEDATDLGVLPPEIRRGEHDAE